MNNDLEFLLGIEKIAENGKEHIMLLFELKTKRKACKVISIVVVVVYQSLVVFDTCKESEITSMTFKIFGTI